jgi:hypothetical protein
MKIIIDNHVLYLQMTTEIYNLILLFFLQCTENELIPIKNRWKWGDVNDSLGLVGLSCVQNMEEKIEN